MAEKKISFGRIFWPSLWAALIVSVLGILIWILVIAGFMSGFEPKAMEVKENTVLHMTLNGTIADRSETSIDPFSLTVDGSLGLPSILHAIEKAKTDDNIKGIFLEIGSLYCGLATAKEIRDAINDFEESGKFVVAYNGGEAITTIEYYISSAANELYGFPTSNVQFLGLGAELMFFKNTLDDLGVEAQVIRGSDNHFKSAVEPFFRENMSDSARHQTETYINAIWDEMLQAISTDRNISVKKLDQLADDASVLNVEDAVKHKLIDETKYRDEVLKLIADKMDNVKVDDIELFAFRKYAKKKFYQDQTLTKADDPNVAVILAEGAVTTDGEGLTSKEICKLFNEVRNDDNIKTVVFRINSPGGSALASDEIWREVKLTNDKKKVIVSMGNVAASGGYYIAAPASYIFAQPTTITGSIGVFGIIPYTGDMMKDKLGITFDRVATNQHSVLTTNRRLSEEEFALIQKNVDNIYGDFKQRVADGRGMTTKQVGVVGRGRVWTGVDAKRVGLVDELGGLNDAIDYAVEKAGIKEPKVLYYPHVKQDKLGEFIAQLEQENESVEISTGMELPKELKDYYAKLKELEGYSGIQMRLPFNLTIK